MKRTAIILITILACIFIFFKLATLQKTPSVLVFDAPISKTRIISSLDQSFLKIKLLPDKYEVSLLERSLKTDQLDSVESFINTNEGQISKGKIAIIGNEKMDEFQAICSILKKHGITKFIINSE